MLCDKLSGDTSCEQCAEQLSCYNIKALVTYVNENVNVV